MPMKNPMKTNPTMVPVLNACDVGTGIGIAVAPVGLGIVGVR